MRLLCSANYLVLELHHIKVRSVECRVVSQEILISDVQDSWLRSSRMQGRSWMDRCSDILVAWWRRSQTSDPLAIVLVLLRCFGSGVLNTHILTFLGAACSCLACEVLQTSCLPKSRLLGFFPPGTAVRHCDEHRGWLPPNLFNCTSVTFSELKGFVS